VRHQQLGLLAVVGGPRKKFSRSQNKPSLCVGYARWQFLLIFLQQCSLVQFAPVLDTGGCEGRITYTHESHSPPARIAAGTSGSRSRSALLWNSELREATMQTDHDVLKNHHNGFVQAFESGMMDDNFTAELTLVIVIALLTGHDLLAGLLSSSNIR
jgi:hypothetical protein